MGAGELNQRLRFEARMLVSDDYGNEVGEFEERFVRSAGVTPLKGTESVMGARLQGRQPVVIRVRRDSETAAIAPSWRAVDVRTGTIYQIKAPPADMLGTRMYLDILAESGVEA